MDLRWMAREMVVSFYETLIANVTGGIMRFKQKQDFLSKHIYSLTQFLIFYKRLLCGNNTIGNTT